MFIIRLISKKIKFMCVAIFLIIMLPLLLFSSCLKSFFYTYDDWAILTAGYDIFSNNFSMGLAIDTVKRIMTTPLRAFVFASWLLDYKLWGVNATAFYATNLFLYVLTCIALFLFLKILFKNIIFAFLVTLTFAIHPINALMAVNVSARPASISLLFYLIALVMFYIFLIKNKLVYYFISLLSAILSSLCKEFSLSLPAAIIMVDYFYLWDTLFKNNRGLDKNKRQSKIIVARILLYIPYVLISFLFLKLFLAPSSLNRGGGYWYHSFPHFSYISFVRHIITGLFFVFKKFVICPANICKYLGLIEPTTIHSIIGDIFLALLFFIALRRILTRQVLSSKILVFGIIWSVINAIPLLGFHSDLRVAFIGMRHYYIVSIGFSCILMWLVLDKSLVELKTKKRSLSSVVILCILFANFSFRSLEFSLLVKNSIAKAKSFYSYLEKSLPKYPAGSNLYYLDNKFDEPLGIFLFYEYPKRMKDLNYFYVLNGTDIILEKDHFPKNKRHQWKRSDFKFDLSSLRLAKSDFILTWNQKEKKIEDSTNLCNELIKQWKEPKTDKVILIPSWDFSNIQKDSGWVACNSRIDYSEKKALKFFSDGYIDDPCNYHSFPTIFSPNFNIPAISIKKIKINMKVSLNIPLGRELIKGDASRGFKDNFYDVFFLLKDPIVGLHWITNEDRLFDEKKLISLPVKADGLFHEYEILPFNSLAWLESKNIIQIGIYPFQFPVEIQIGFIEFVL